MAGHPFAQRLARIAAPDLLSARRAYYAAYSVCFAVLAIACFGWLYASGHCLIWEDDGIDQHFTFFCYFGTWMREAISSGTLREWDFSLGYGSDVICTLASWIGEPFNLLSILCPERYSEYLYQVLVIVRLYLAGLAFSAFCRYHEREGFAALLGALAYAFSGFCLVWGAFRHTMFIDPAFLLPWVLLGADKVLDGKRPTVLLVSCALTFITYFYFAYMIVIFLVLYCLLRYFVGGRGEGGPRRSVRSFSALVGRFALYVFASALVAGALLAPIVMYVLQMGRLGADRPLEVFQQLGRYVLLPLTFAGGSSFDRGPAMEPLAVFAVSALFLAAAFKRKPDMRQVKVTLSILAAFALFPVFESVLNGLSYPTDRWMFALAMAVAYAIVLVAARLCELKRRDWIAIGVVFALLAADAVALLFAWFNQAWTAFTLAFSIVTFTGLHLAWKRQDTAVTRIVLMAVLAVGVVGFSNFDLASRESDSDRYPLVEHMARFGHVYEEMTASPSGILADLEGATAHSQGSAGEEEPSGEAPSGNAPSGEASSGEASSGEATAVEAPSGEASAPYRIDKATELVRRNSSALQGLYSVDLYASVYSQTVDDFRIDLAIPQDTDLQSHHIYTSDSRTAVETISSVKYFLKKAGDRSVKPYGFNELVATDTVDGADLELWQTDFALPFAFAYRSAIPLGEYEAYDPLRRQQALLQGCAVDSSSVPVAAFDDTAVEVDFSIDEEKSSGIRLQEDGSIMCLEKGATIALEFEGAPNAETYVYLDNMNFAPLLPSELLSAEQRASLSFAERMALFFDDHRSDTVRDYRITFTNGRFQKVTRFSTPSGNFYSGKHTWLVNTGYARKASTGVTLTVEKAGVLSFDALKVICQPLNGFKKQVAALAADPVTVKLATNTVTGTIEADGPRLLYLSTPYSEGWSATVDGEAVEVKRANSGFMAIEVEPGSHAFTFSYETPYLAVGVVLSAIGVALCAGIIAFNRRRPR